MWQRLWRRWRYRLTMEQRELVLALREGYVLKGHRYLDGRKEYRLYDGPTAIRDVATTEVEALQRARLLDSNMKFPAAMFFLSEQGRRLADDLHEASP